MTDEILQRAVEKSADGEAYALATVVAVDRPVSARLGDRALITKGGELRGWIGGACSEPIVIREAMAALRDGRARLLRIRPPGSPREPEGPGVVTEVTTCASEGGMDVFVEPHLARPQIAVVGSSPAARMVARIAPLVGYRVTAVLDDPSEKSVGTVDAIDVDSLLRLDLDAADAVVIATMNRYDDVALEAALGTGAGYIGVIASSARGRSLLSILIARGVLSEKLDRVRVPAGLDLGPSTQEEIALAVVTEVVAARHKRSVEPNTGRPCEDEPAEAVDPVCGMTVAVVPGALNATVNGDNFFFCGPGCRDAFLASPGSFPTGRSATR
jgi:xanthine dehydrogenase accessory factor